MNEADVKPKSHRTVFTIVFLMLCGLTGLSYWIANSHLMDNQLTGWLAMMAVSVAKAMLVITFFMHLWWEKKWKYVLTIPALLMGMLLVVLLVPDVADRIATYSKTRTDNAPQAVEAESTKPVESSH
jgi:cytochrome c oxidase subunit 4